MRDGVSLLDGRVREGARRMPAAALGPRSMPYLADLADQRDQDGRRLVVRNTYHRPRCQCRGDRSERSAVNEKRSNPETGERKRFSLAILPPWARNSPWDAEVLPLLYMHGLSTGDCVQALEQFFGSAAGLSLATVTRLTEQWQADHAALAPRNLSKPAYINCSAERHRREGTLPTYPSLRSTLSYEASSGV